MTGTATETVRPYVDVVRAVGDAGEAGRAGMLTAGGPGRALIPGGCDVDRLV
jgi:hypothetical protein